MKKIFFFTLLFVSIIAFNSCKKKGCTDESALNFESGAEKDNGSCTYPKYQAGLLHNFDLISAPIDTSFGNYKMLIQFYIADSATNEIFWDAGYIYDGLPFPINGSNIFQAIKPLEPLDRTLYFQVAITDATMGAGTPEGMGPFYFKPSSTGKQIETFNFKNPAMGFEMNLRVSYY